MVSKRALEFASEAALVQAFCDAVCRHRKNPWKFYHETGGFDLLLAHSETGVQVGIEAKMLLNLKVLDQILPSYRWEKTGPDYRAVLVPTGKVQHNLAGIAKRVGVGVICVDPSWGKYSYGYVDLPDEEDNSYEYWHPWLPLERVRLPDYVPDVSGGKPSPVKLTIWKIKAIKLIILLERNGAVSRSTMKFLGISPTAWTKPGGYLEPTTKGYVRCSRTPDFFKQHPVNYAEIEADFEKWAPPPSMVQGAMI